MNKVSVYIKALIMLCLLLCSAPLVLADIVVNEYYATVDIVHADSGLVILNDTEYRVDGRTALSNRHGNAVSLSYFKENMHVRFKDNQNLVLEFMQHIDDPDVSADESGDANSTGGNMRQEGNVWKN